MHCKGSLVTIDWVGQGVLLVYTSACLPSCWNHQWPGLQQRPRKCWHIGAGWMPLSCFFSLRLTFKHSLIKVAGMRYVHPKKRGFDSAFPSLYPTVSSLRYCKKKSSVLAVFSWSCQGKLASKMWLFMWTFVQEDKISMLALKAWIRGEKTSEGKA